MLSKRTTTVVVSQQYFQKGSQGKVQGSLRVVLAWFGAEDSEGWAGLGQNLQCVELLEVSGLILEWMSLNKLVLIHFKFSLLCLVYIVSQLCQSYYSFAICGFCFVCESLSATCTFFHPTSSPVHQARRWCSVSRCLCRAGPTLKVLWLCIVLTAASQLLLGWRDFDKAPDFRIDKMWKKMFIFESMKYSNNLIIKSNSYLGDITNYIYYH